MQSLSPVRVIIYGLVTLISNYGSHIFCGLARVKSSLPTQCDQVDCVYHCLIWDFCSCTLVCE
jgi:hypothetical protein